MIVNPLNQLDYHIATNYACGMHTTSTSTVYGSIVYSIMHYEDKCDQRTKGVVQPTDIVNVTNRLMGACDVAKGHSRTYTIAL